MGLQLKLFVKPVQIIRTLVISKSPVITNNAMQMYCGKKMFLVGRHQFMGTSFRLYSTSPLHNVPKKKFIFKMPEIRRLLSLAKPEKWTLTGALCLLLVSSSITMAVPFCLGKVIDIIYTTDTSKMRDNLNKMSVLLLGQRITQRLRELVFGSIVRQEVAFFDKNKTGELVNRLSADTSLVSQSVTMNISDGIRSTIMVAAGVSMMDSLATATQVAEERIANIRTVKSFSQERKECDAYSNKIQRVLELAYKEALARGIFFGLTGFSGNVIVLSVLYYGGIMVSNSDLTVGKLSAFLLYAAYIGVSIGGLSSFYSEMNRGLGASTRLWELVDREPKIPLSGGLMPVNEPVGQISFQNVSFKYPSRPDTRIIQDLSLEIPPSSITAIVGASGSGKSTLAALMLRLYDPDNGVVSLDGNCLTHLDPLWLRKHIGTVSQEPVLFSCSIRENILYGAPNPSAVTEEQLEANPRILVLDEATSALDAENQIVVLDHGRVVEKGTYNDLLSMDNGAFKKLIQHQTDRVQLRV
ncbi:ATP-binding cassette sub-family B member 10 [Blattella germanica]|nr:ATP-binding cassette sub-family B member 10 [Blattella germanica]